MDSFISVYRTLLESGFVKPIPTDGVDSITRMGCELFEYLSERITSEPGTDEYWSELEETFTEFESLPSQKEFVASIKNISVALTMGVTQDYKTLVNNIAPVVDKLTNAIDERIVTELKNNGFETILDDYTHGDDLVIFTWDAATYPASRFDVVDHIKSMTNSSRNEENVFDLKNAINYGMKGRHSVKNVGIPQETINSVLSEPVRGIDFDPDQMRKIFPVAMSKVSYEVKMNNLLEAIKKPSVEQFQRISNEVVDLFDLIGIIRNNLSGMELSSEAVETMGDNLRALTDLTFAYAYYLSYFKNVAHKDTLILDKNTVNGPVFSEYEKSGGTLEDVGVFIHGRYSDGSMPRNGISTQTFVRDLPSARKMSNKMTIEAKAHAAKERMNATQRAFRYVMSQFIRSVDASELPDVGTISPQQRKEATNRAARMSVAVRLNKEAIEDHVYSLVIDFLYGDGESNIKEMYGDYLTLHSSLKENGNITETDISFVDACVFSNCATSFITKAMNK